ncbi:kinetochore-associated Ndc80 complex subunit nuf2 [Ophidiomyces ophidiicola]|uniref:Kinetochore-associated Ndc80 complex subunit nuf2 n=1 Tax=Ophidiomyces ophidiicola TaxID=1387563 RepID=A0ACB8UV87_9EURO|nr:kinetochore-associated Ndc80 complex subunit nuf2 [Ophidiomyces ophidiicola]KAI1916653.1 kinetochore-associated Ndc80 complex subunit nuf2 [Ophidiomyces ophidiicola]KAI1918394.1 kinetochore-associated Ndc80 complex subunit nuf2 [Ophidiomyces ophidiicola]KAI1925850.1 kinetochore-associated Ndc80 complex subunit nuf2 [Ophidiomyces ophidiicola]KAI1944956.1 kinetochore-associated Ndc80 complex subunit nuf2 [Ophidiomyces ophidiicola]KAI1945069.1 kinetochore-associated Ndc80 complex subunit nuf2 
MAYNSRASQQFHHGSQQQHNRGRKPKEDDTDAFLRLPDKVIAGCINDIGIPFAVADLLKPNPQQIQIVFEWFAELFMNITRETVEPAMQAAAEDICADYVGIIPPDSRNLMAFFVSLRKLMMQCGVHDFTFTDLTKPTYDRVAKIFSYLINFVRFRESQTAVIDEHFNKSENTKSYIESLQVENQEMERRLQQMKSQQKEMEGTVREKIKRNDELKARLLELRRNQERVAETFEKVKGDKARTQSVLEEKTEKLLKTRQESEKLRPYVSQSPAILQAALTELSENLNRDKIQIDNMERRMRALQMSMDTFGVISNDVQSCIKVLEDVSAELQKEEEEDARAIRNRDALAERGNTVREVAQTEKLLQRQLARWHERTEALRKSAREKAEQAQARMEELHSIQKQLREERGEKQRDMERRKIRIEQTEKKMVDLKENIENEIHRAHDEYLKMESHIKLYITEMEKCL